MQSQIFELNSPVLLSEAPVWINKLPCWVQAGFPSPAEDHVVQRVDLMNQGHADVVRITRATPPKAVQQALAAADFVFHLAGVNQQWRVWFEWKDADAYNVEIVDYH